MRERTAKAIKLPRSQAILLSLKELKKAYKELYNIKGIWVSTKKINKYKESLTYRQKSKIKSLLSSMFWDLQFERKSTAYSRVRQGLRLNPKNQELRLANYAFYCLNAEPERELNSMEDILLSPKVPLPKTKGQLYGLYTLSILQREFFQDKKEWDLPYLYFGRATFLWLQGYTRLAIEDLKKVEELTTEIPSHYRKLLALSGLLAKNISETGQSEANTLTEKFYKGTFDKFQIEDLRFGTLDESTYKGRSDKFQIEYSRFGILGENTNDKVLILYERYLWNTVVVKLGERKALEEEHAFSKTLEGKIEDPDVGVIKSIGVFDTKTGPALVTVRESGKTLYQILEHFGRDIPKNLQMPYGIWELERLSEISSKVFRKLPGAFIRTIFTKEKDFSVPQKLFEELKNLRFKRKKLSQSLKDRKKAEQSLTPEGRLLKRVADNLLHLHLNVGLEHCKGKRRDYHVETVQRLRELGYDDLADVLEKSYSIVVNAVNKSPLVYRKDPHPENWLVITPEYGRDPKLIILDTPVTAPTRATIELSDLLNYIESFSWLSSDSDVKKEIVMYYAKRALEEGLTDLHPSMFLLSYYNTVIHRAFNLACLFSQRPTRKKALKIVLENGLSAFESLEEDGHILQLDETRRYYTRNKDDYDKLKTALKELQRRLVVSDTSSDEYVF